MNQVERFKKRSRDERPDVARAKVLADPFLHQMYSDTLKHLVDAAIGGGTAPDDLTIAEIGSAGGITNVVYPSISTSDIRLGPGVDQECDAQQLIFDDSSLDGLIAKDVLHHLPDVRQHLREVRRVLKPGARATYVEPNWNLLSRAVFTFAHPEPFLPKQRTWEFESDDPMYANQALAYIIFVRDRGTLESEFPDLRFHVGDSFNGLAMLMSGGVHTRTSVSARWLQRIHAVEQRHSGWRKHVGLSRLIVIEKS